MWRLPAATVIGALTSALLFTRRGLRPWEALPVGFVVMIAVYAIASSFARPVRKKP